eukprot:8235033-Pyramimonas_sp.AAC.1
MTRPSQLKPAYIRKLLPLRLDIHGGQVHANRCTYGEFLAVNNLRSSACQVGDLDEELAQKAERQ